MEKEKEIEIWKPVVGFEGSYEVSNLGRVRSVDRFITNSLGRTYFSKGVILKWVLDKGGYPMVGLSLHNKYYSRKIHRLVAEAFIENPYNLPSINHKDEDKTNNKVENLEFCTVKYNNNYGNHNLKQSLTRRADPNLTKSVLKLSLTGEVLKQYPCVRDVVIDGYKERTVAEVCRFEKPSAYGYLWIFASERHRINEMVSRYASCRKRVNKKILAFKLDGSFYKLFNTVGEAEKELNINHSSIFLCCNKKQKFAKGFTFKYAE